jgi:hypothetical protein
MTKDLANVLVGGGGASEVSCAPKGSTLPTDLDALEAPFEGTGWLSEEGTSFSREEERQVSRGHQGGAIVKRITASVDDSFKFQCLETTALVLGLMFKGQVPVVTTGVAKITITDQANSDERAWVIDEVLDDGSIERYVIPDGSAQLTAEVVRKHNELTVYEFTVGVTGDYFLYTDAPGVVGA